MPSNLAAGTIVQQLRPSIPSGQPGDRWTVLDLMPDQKLPHPGMVRVKSHATERIVFLPTVLFEVVPHE